MAAATMKRQASFMIWFDINWTSCIINDIWDKDIDKKVERTKTRPLASGQLQLNQAFKFLSIHLTGGLVVLS